MKLLGWMHRKFRQNDGDAFVDLASGATCNCLSNCPPLVDHRFSPSVPTRITKNFQPFPDEEFMLDGLLTIGTLGVSSDATKEEMLMQEYQIPTAESLEAIAEKVETEEATEADMMVINAELEKVLAAEAEKEGDRLSSARPSHAAKASTECPLQDYLFGAKVEAATEQKEKRASLGELFMIDEGGNQKGKEEVSDVSGDGSETGVQQMMKRMLTRRKSASQNSAASGEHATTPTAKIHKVMQMFHRKVHPENDTASKKSTKANKSAGVVPYIGNCFSGGRGSDLVTTSESKCRREHIAGLNSIQDGPPFSLSGSDSTGSREYWIKTDVDYLVLEL